jgi:hypothetical protein
VGVRSPVVVTPPRSVHRLACALAATSILAIAASGCTFGADTARSVADAGPGQACDDRLTSCAQGLLCVALACRSTCSSSQDCASTERCLGVVIPDSGVGVGVCVDRASMACSPNCMGSCTCPGPSCSFCPNGSICASDGQCRDQCNLGAGSSCNPGDHCMSVQSGPSVCVGAAPHDTASATDGG